MRKITKGHYGYLRYKKRLEIAKCLVITAGIMILLTIGYSVSHSRRNLMTVAAVLSVLPLANILVPLIVILPFKGREKTEYERVRSIAGDGLLNTELVITGQKIKTAALDYVLIHPAGVICYTHDPDMDVKAVEEHIRLILQKHHLHSEIKIFRDLSKFENRIRGLTQVSRESCDEELLKIEGVLRAISM